MALTGLAIAAAVGLAKSQLVDKPAADAQRKLAAATAAYSPWTGMKPGAVQNANPFASMMQYGAAGAQIGGNIDASNKATPGQTLNPYGGQGTIVNNGASVGAGGSNYNPQTGAGTLTNGMDFKQVNPQIKPVAMTSYPPGYKGTNSPWLPPPMPDIGGSNNDSEMAQYQQYMNKNPYA